MVTVYNNKLINDVSFRVAVLSLIIAFLSGGCGDPGYTFSPVGVPSLISDMASKELSVDSTEWKLAQDASIPSSIQ